MGLASNSGIGKVAVIYNSAGFCGIGRSMFYATSISFLPPPSPPSCSPLSTVDSNTTHAAATSTPPHESNNGWTQGEKEPQRAANQGHDEGGGAEAGVASNWNDEGRGKTHLHTTRYVASPPYTTLLTSPPFLAVNNGMASRPFDPVDVPNPSRAPQTTARAPNPLRIIATAAEHNTNNHKPTQEAVKRRQNPNTSPSHTENAAERNTNGGHKTTRYVARYLTQFTDHPPLSSRKSCWRWMPRPSHFL